MSTILSEIQSKTNEILGFWQNKAREYASPRSRAKLEATRLDLIKDLTDTLTIWQKKLPSLKDGELILAYANLGTLVEGWSKFFYCFYYKSYEDYQKDKKHINQEKRISTKKERKREKLLMKEIMIRASFEKSKLDNDISDFIDTMINSSIVEQLFNENRELQEWTHEIINKKRIVDVFNSTDIKNSMEFEEDLKQLSLFIDEINSKLNYPDGYFTHNLY